MPSAYLNHSKYYSVKCHDRINVKLFDVDNIQYNDLWCVSWQVWLCPMWTPACLLIRAALLWSVSASTCWTWFPPVLSPKQPTHGNNAILLPTDNITIIFLISITAILIIILILSMDSASARNGAVRISIFFCWLEVLLHSPLRSFCCHLPYINPSSRSGVVLQQLGHEEFLKCGYLSEGWDKHGLVQNHKLLQWCCLSLPVYWLNLPVAWRGSCHPIP